jgi:hypothetical protein
MHVWRHAVCSLHSFLLVSSSRALSGTKLLTMRQYRSAILQLLVPQTYKSNSELSAQETEWVLEYKELNPEIFEQGRKEPEPQTRTARRRQQQQHQDPEIVVSSRKHVDGTAEDPIHKASLRHRQHLYRSHEWALNLSDRTRTATMRNHIDATDEMLDKLPED